MASAVLNPRPFVVTDGGPTYLIQKRLGLIRENAPRVALRALISVLVTWLPLLILSALQHHVAGSRVAVPFLKDFAVHTRFLLALPLLILAENIIGPHLGHAAAHFITSGLVVKADYEHYERAVDDGLRLRDSALIEGLLLALSFAVCAVTFSSLGIHVSSWSVTRSATSESLTWAGWWFVFFCIPLFQFFFLRWLWRFFLWGQFLWRINRLDLKLIPTHPDEAAGLGFLGEAQRFFGMILFAYSTAIAGVVADNVIYGKIPLTHFAPAIAAYVLLGVLVALLPIATFAARLLQTKRRGLYQYGSLATEYTSAFHQKWIVSHASEDEELLGTGDIRSLADLGNSFGFIEKMGPMPMGPRTPIQLVLACLLPMAPLLLTVMPLGEVLKLLFKVVM